LKVLVTGGNGFIGGYVCERLADLGHEHAIFDHVHRTPYSCAHGEGGLYVGDVRDEVAVFEAVYHSDGVIHLAGVLGTQETIANPKPAIETNILGSMNVFKACELYKKKCVYVAVGNHWMNNPYSITKTTAERFALMLNKERGTQIAIVRGLNAYGPRQKIGPVRKIMPNFIVPALQGKPITIYGDGSQVMDMIYVSDLADILCRALLVEHGIYDKVFEAGTGRATTVLQIAEKVIHAAAGGTISFKPMRPGEPAHSEVMGDPATLKPLYPGADNLTFDIYGNSEQWPFVDRDRQWGPFVELAVGIERTIDYYRALLEQHKSQEVFA